MIEFFNQILDHFNIPLENPIIVFSLILFIILLAPIVLKKLNIPGIIGLIIAGIVIGPKGFGVLENDSAVNLFSTIGLLYIMFIAGLDLDLNQFKANKYKSIFFGFFTFIIPLAIGFPVYYYVLSIWDGHITMEAALLTASMFGTHTLVTYPIVSKLGISKNTAVAITVGGTMLTDTAVLILLAVIVGSHDGGLTQEFWIRLGISITLFSAFMFLIIPRITKWFFRKFSSEKHQHYIFVLVSARRGAKSYMRVLEQLPAKRHKYFDANSRFVIYPQHFDDVVNDQYADISAVPLTKGIDVVQKLGKGIGSIFRTEVEEEGDN